MKLTAKADRYTEDISEFFSQKKGNIRELKIKNADFCCDELEAAWGEFIKFGEYDSFLNTNKNVNIYSCSPWAEGAVWDEMAIKYCPFCAVEIVVVIT